MSNLEVLTGVGEILEAQIIELASINGERCNPTPEQPERYATNRVALTAEDRLAREKFIRPRMEAAGMEIDDEHPMGLIGILRGKQSDLAPLVVLSHIDTLQGGDMYDGTLGVLGGIEAVRAMRETGFMPDRDIMLISLTGEESAGYNRAVFGSRSMFQGLTPADLDSRTDPSNPSIREMLSDEEIERTEQPIFGPGRKYKLPHAVIELHVEQDSSLDRENIDLGIVEAIAAPVRFSVQIGEPTDKNTAGFQPKPFASSKTIDLIVDGRADHSGATPMGAGNRADGLAETAEFLLPILNAGHGDELGYGISRMLIEQINIDGEAMNRIPGEVSTRLRIEADTRGKVDSLLKQFSYKVQARNNFHGISSDLFSPNALTIEKSGPNASQNLPDASMQPNHISALMLASRVQKIAGKYAEKGVVGTATRYRTGSGQVHLGLDIRGIDKASRDMAMADIASFSGLTKVDFGEALPGSGDPVTMDQRLVKIMQEEIDRRRIGTSKIMVSAAVHDTQNAARAGVPSLMVFVPSLAGGKAHHPDAYTAPLSIEKGTKTLLAFMLRMSQNA